MHFTRLKPAQRLHAIHELQRPELRHSFRRYPVPGRSDIVEHVLIVAIAVSILIIGIAVVLL